MKTFATILLIVELVSANTPHLLCRVTCAKTEQAVFQTSKCSHCGDENSKPLQAPSRDCDAGCCEQIHVLPSTSHTVDVALRTELDFLTLDFSTAEESVATVAADRNVQSPRTPFAAHPGCALPVLLGHLLL